MIYFSGFSALLYFLDAITGLGHKPGSFASRRGLQAFSQVMQLAR
jgi:hypothetical protein